MKNIQAKESIDMITLKMPYTTIFSSLIKKWEYLDQLENHWGSDKYYSEKFQLKTSQDSTIKFNVGKVNKDQSQYIFIEWNPNKIDITKVDNDSLHKILEYSFNKNIKHDDMERIEVQRVDYALDFEIPIESIIVDHSKEYTAKIDSRKGLTKYYGSPESNGMVRLYDKAKETGQSGPLTRLETVFKPKARYNDVDSIKHCMKSIEQLRAYEKLEDYSSLSDTLKVHYFALENGYDITKFTRTYRKKIVEVLETRQKKISIKATKGPLITYLEFIETLQDYYINQDEILSENEKPPSFNVSDAYDYQWNIDKQGFYSR